MRFIVTGLFAAAAIVLSTLAPAVAADTPRAVAHRGTHTDCPYTENTIKSFRHCAGDADAIEIDLRVSKDGKPVFIHDATLNRTTKATGRVDARTFAQLRRITTEDGQGRIPSTRVIRNHIAATGQTVFIDVKTYPRKEGWRILTRELHRHRARVVFFSASNNQYVKAAKGKGFQAAHYTRASQPVPSVATVRATGGWVWRSTLTNAQAARFRDAGLRRVGGANLPHKWELLAGQGAWGVNTDELPGYLAWRR